MRKYHIEIGMNLCRTIALPLSAPALKVKCLCCASINNISIKQSAFDWKIASSHLDWCCKRFLTWENAVPRRARLCVCVILALTLVVFDSYTSCSVPLLFNNQFVFFPFFSSFPPLGLFMCGSAERWHASFGRLLFANSRHHLLVFESVLRARCRRWWMDGE